MVNIFMVIIAGMLIVSVFATYSRSGKIENLEVKKVMRNLISSSMILSVLLFLLLLTSLMGLTI